MRPKLQTQRVSVVFVALFAALLAITAGIYKASAARGINNDFYVSIYTPEDDGDTFTLTAYTPNLAVPAQIPIGVKAFVSDAPFRVTTPVLDSVRMVLGGDVDEANNQITGEKQSVVATLFDSNLANDSYVGVLNAALLDFETVPARGLLPSLAASDFIRAVAIVDEYYTPARTVSSIGGISEIGIDVNLRNLAEIDADGNLIPDASALLQQQLIIFGPNGEIVIVLSLGDLAVVRGITGIEYGVTVETALGPMDVNILAPDLEAMQALAAGALDAYDTARLIVAIEATPEGLLDGPEGVDPLSEFDLDSPAPQNLFARVNIGLTTVGPVVRGTAEVPSWTFLDNLPGGLVFELELSGPAIASLLSDGVEVAGYTYNVTMSQEPDGEDIFADGDETGWAEAADVSTANNNNADDDADARVEIAADGDDTIEIRSANVSAIYGSNAVPAAPSSGRKSGCFIATAAFGTPMARQLDTLRGVRDGYLLSNPVGAIFADAYYRLSPPIAGDIAQNNTAQFLVRTALWPVIAISRWLLASPATIALGLFTLAGLSVYAIRQRRA